MASAPSTASGRAIALHPRTRLVVRLARNGLHFGPALQVLFLVKAGYEFDLSEGDEGLQRGEAFQAPRHSVQHAVRAVEGLQLLHLLKTQRYLSYVEHVRCEVLQPKAAQASEVDRRPIFEALTAIDVHALQVWRVLDDLQEEI
eukprot:CAMPEP_0206422040 /NCGR_PEP_ID=MMETSP0324_2-20121206/1829_1 /ASSEMBLY_ACC=CAM_ASM_000836 /TAXON_ID=2866 /ORGANISM="Crypthecodinium cohnii, Strain Seligo" /LENGTH=143 /DNA_ID=CAMNT_0053886295 /DNA_START=753 /DNA_END=1184 /DNA_ORIENTATION=-